MKSFRTSPLKTKSKRDLLMKSLKKSRSNPKNKMTSLFTMNYRLKCINGQPKSTQNKVESGRSSILSTFTSKN